MKNKFKILLTVLLGAVMCFAAVSLPACGNNEDPADTNPVVYSNGGTVVRCGDEVYFVNGVPDYTDPNGKTNVTGSVVKGGLYKTTVTEYRKSLAEAKKEQAEKEAAETGGEAVFDTKVEGFTDVLDFANFDKLDYIDLGQYTIGSETEAARVTDENGNTHQNYIPTNGGSSEYRIASEQVISKKIGTSGYADGGFWIFDNIVYFATPDTDRNAEGEVQYNRAEFYSYDLATESMTLLYTAREINAAVPYAFYKRDDGNVYLVTYEKYFANADDETNDILTGYIVSTAVTDGRPGETKEIASGVDSVYFPRIETYDPANPVNTVKDYVYYTRAATSSDHPSKGSRLEMVRPDGNVSEVKNADGKVVIEAGAGIKTVTSSTVGTITIEGVAGDYLYYRNPVANGKTQLECTNLNWLLKEYDPAAAVGAMPESAKVVLSDVSGYTTILPIEQGELPCVLAVNTEGVFNISPGQANVKVYEGEATLLAYNKGRAYGTVSDEKYSMFISFSAFRPYGDKTVNVLGNSVPSAAFDLDFFSISYMTESNGKDIETEEAYAFYFANYTETATNYAYIIKLSGMYNLDKPNGLPGVKLGQIADHERPSIVCYDDECINWTHDHSSWDDLTPDEEEEPVA